MNSELNESELVEALLPLARLIAGNVMAHEAGDTADGNDAHFAAQVVDGLHDQMPQVKGALDGLSVAMEHDEYQEALLRLTKSKVAETVTEEMIEAGVKAAAAQGLLIYPGRAAVVVRAIYLAMRSSSPPEIEGE